MKVFQINAPRVVHQTLDGESIIIDFESGAYFSTDGVGAVIWEQVGKGATLEEIVRVLSGRYDADPKDLEAAAVEFLTQLEQDLLIATDDVDGAGSPGPADSPANARSAFQAPVLHKYTDMQDLLLLDPIHEVEAEGWPAQRKDSTV